MIPCRYMLSKAIAIIDDEADLVNLFSEALRLNSLSLWFY